MATTAAELVLPFDRLSRADVPYAGGKGANLGELTAAGLPVPDGFVVGAPAYAAFCDANDLRGRVQQLLSGVDVDDGAALRAAAAEAREMVVAEPPGDDLRDSIRRSYTALAGGADDVAVAVRSSATAEDTESASFAGMNETFLNVRGADARDRRGARAAGPRCSAPARSSTAPSAASARPTWTSPWSCSARSQSTRAGVMFTVDPASGRDGPARDRRRRSGSASRSSRAASRPTATSWTRMRSPILEPRGPAQGAGDRVAAPAAARCTREARADEATAPVLTDEEVRAARASSGCGIEQHYGTPQDTEWAFDPDGDGLDAAVAAGDRRRAAPSRRAGRRRRRGRSSAGSARRRASRPARCGVDRARWPTRDALADGDVLVTHMTAPDWVPLMRRAAAIVTDSGGMTCHAAIVSRELGIPCVVGTGDATDALRDGELVTVDADPRRRARGPRRAEDAAPPRRRPRRRGRCRSPARRLLVNLSEPSQVERAAALDVEGVGLLRAELMVLEALEGAHPRAAARAGPR